MKGPWRNKLATKFFLSYLVVISLVFGLYYLYSASIVRRFYISSLSSKMEREARIVSRLLPPKVSGDTLDQMSRELARGLGVRLTVIALDGKVLGDSHEASVTMENHRTRPEIAEALSRGEGQSIRYSATVGHEMLYRAVLQKGDDRIIRLSLSLEAMESAVRPIRNGMLLGLLGASGLGLILGLFFSRRIGSRVRRMVEFSHRVAGGSFPQPSWPKGGDELSLLEKNLAAMSRSIQEKVGEIVAEREKIESILRCMNEGVLAVDTRGRIILLNENVRKMFGLPSSVSLHGASPMEISRHPEMKKLVEEVLLCDCSRECFKKEICLGDQKWLRVGAASLRAADERPLGYILVFHDVTELKRLETVRADFVANVCHELRTPLTAIRGYAETLLRHPPADPADAQDFLNTIQRHSERLGRLIDGLLTLSALESGELRLAREEIGVADLVGQVFEIFREKARTKKITLNQAIEPSLPPVRGDPDRLQQLLINLVDNAVKYTPEGGEVKVTARMMRSQSSGPEMVEIEVADTGCGVPEKDLPRLTERFYRVDKARSRELGGTGLGLAIVKHIVQAHNGSLKIESQLGKGTKVKVALPALG